MIYQQNPNWKTFLLLTLVCHGTLTKRHTSITSLPLYRANVFFFFLVVSFFLPSQRAVYYIFNCSYLLLDSLAYILASSPWQFTISSALLYQQSNLALSCLTQPLLNTLAVLRENTIQKENPENWILMLPLATVAYISPLLQKRRVPRPPHIWKLLMLKSFLSDGMAFAYELDTLSCML